MISKKHTHKQLLYLGIFALPGFIIHLGTALLRLKTFFPYPKLLDFSAFYAASAALRQGLLPYGLDPAWLKELQIQRGIPFRPPAIYNPPIWPWILQPLSRFRFPGAAWFWFLFNIALLIWCASVLSHLAGYKGWKAQLLVLILVITFGPVFLDLTLGQTSVFLLATALFIGINLRENQRFSTLYAAIAAGCAAGVKLFPAIWIAAFALMHRWRLFVVGMLAICLALGIGFLLMPQANQMYWFKFLPQRVTSASTQTGIDDQSLMAWIDRIGRPHSYKVPGLHPGARTTVNWTPPWSFNSQQIRWFSYGLSALFAIPSLLLFLHTKLNQEQAEFYLWVLYTLLVFPHIERYNHALLLPAMAWLWGQGTWQRYLVVLVYGLAGLSRLNHFWVIYLAAPWGPFASGFGTIAVIFLGLGIHLTLRGPRKVVRNLEGVGFGR